MNKSKRTYKIGNDQVDQIKGCHVLQKAVYRISYRDPNNAMAEKVRQQRIREVLIILIDIKKYQSELYMRNCLRVWLSQAKKMAILYEKRFLALKHLFTLVEMKLKTTLLKYFQQWKFASSGNATDFLERILNVESFIKLTVSTCLKRHRQEFFKRLRERISPEKLFMKIDRCLSISDRIWTDYMRKKFNEWRVKAKASELYELKFKLLRNSICSPFVNRERKSLFRAFRTWYHNVQAEKLQTGNYRAVLCKSIYEKFSKIGQFAKHQALSQAFYKWLRNAEYIKNVGTNMVQQRITDAKKHMLKHNVNMNAERLINRLREVFITRMKIMKLRTTVLGAGKYQKIAMRRVIREWLTNANKMKQQQLYRDLQLKLASKIMDNYNRNNVTFVLNRAFQTWRRNCMGPDMSLPNTEKAVKILRKTAVSPFFEQVRRAMARSNELNKVKKIFKKLFLKGDDELIHWWFSTWRSKVAKIKVKEFEDRILHIIEEQNERITKITETYEITTIETQQKQNDFIKKKILKVLFEHRDKLGNLDEQSRLALAFQRWRTNIRDIETPFVKIKPYTYGVNILQRYCLRKNFRDVLDSYKEKARSSIIQRVFTRILTGNDRNNYYNNLRKSFYKWRFTKPQENFSGYKLRVLFEKYYHNSPNVRRKMFESYIEILEILGQAADLKNQIYNQRVRESLFAVYNRYYYHKLEILKYVLNKWNKNTRKLQAIEDANIIQEFCRKKLEERLMKKKRLEDFCNHIKNALSRKFIQKIYSTIRWNEILNFLKKRVGSLEGYNNEMIVKKYKQWHEKLNIFKTVDAIIRIQSFYRAYKFRKELDRLFTIKFVLFNIVSRTLEKHSLEPAFQKWRKNVMEVKLEEKATVIQDFCKTKLYLALKLRAKKGLNDLFKKYIYRNIYTVIEGASHLNKPAANNLYNVLYKLTLRKHYPQLAEGLRQIMIRKLMEKLLPNLYAKLRARLVPKYFELWYKNAVFIPNTAAEKLQAWIRGSLLRKFMTKNAKILDCLYGWINRANQNSEDIVRSNLAKWRKNTIRDKLEEKSTIIQDFCKNMVYKVKSKNREMWLRLIMKMRPAKISLCAKLFMLLRLWKKLYFRRMIDGMIDNINKKYISSVLLRLISSWTTKNEDDLKRQKLRQWSGVVWRMKNNEQCAAIALQRILKGHMVRKNYKCTVKKQNIMNELIYRFKLKTDMIVPTSFFKWNKNAQIIKLEDKATIIQDFCKEFIEKSKKAKERAYYERIMQGLEKLSKVEPGYRHGFDAIKYRVKLTKVEDIYDILDDLRKKKIKEAFDTLMKHRMNLIMNQLFPLTEGLKSRLLKQKFLQWKEKTDRLGRIIDALLRAFGHIDEFKKYLLERKFKQWRSNVQKMNDDINKRRIAKYIEERYRVSKARQNWKKLAREYDAYCDNNELYYLRKRLCKFTAICKLNNLLKNKLTTNGLGQFEDGINFARTLKFIKYLIENWDRRNQLLTLKYYLRKWNDKAKKLSDLEDALNYALYMIEKRDVINSASALNDACLCKAIDNLVKFARMKYFFKKLRDNYEHWIRISSLFREACMRFSDEEQERIKGILRKKLLQWKDKAKKITEDVNKIRIAKYLEERYRVSKARENWKKFAREYEAYCDNKELYYLRKRLGKYTAICKLNELLKNKFIENGRDQFEEGINFAKTLRFIKYLIENWDRRNQLLISKYYLKRWFDKTKKLREREEALEDALTMIEKRDIINSAEIVDKASLIKKLNSLVITARLKYFYKKLRDNYERWLRISALFREACMRFSDEEQERIRGILRKKLLQWRDQAKKVTEEANKIRIAKYFEERYRISKARQNWKKFAREYEAYCENRELYYLRKRLGKFTAICKLNKLLHNKLTSNGVEQFEDGINFAKTLRFIKYLIENWDRRNQLLKMKYILRRWNEKTRILKDREDALIDALSMIEKRDVINSAEVIDKVSLIKQINSLVIVARMKFFFKKLRDNYEHWIRISAIFREACMRFSDEEQERIKGILRKKLLQWKEKAKKITEEANKIRIAKYMEERYRISNARKNWKKFAREYEAYCENKELYYLRKRLGKFTAICKLNDLLKDKLTKAGKEQFEDGVSFARTLRFIKYLIENWDRRNQLLRMKYILRRWSDKTKKLKEREEALEDALTMIEKRDIINSAEIVDKASLIKQLNSLVMVARMKYFYKKLRDNYERWLRISALFREACMRFSDEEQERIRGILRKKLLQWRDQAKKITEDVNKIRIASYIEERYRTSKARQNWKKLAREYEAYCDNRELYLFRKSLTKYLVLRKLNDTLKNKLLKEGEDQFRDGVNFAKTLRFIKYLIENWDRRNQLLITKYYLRRWSDKTKKLKQREEALEDALYMIEKRDIINAADTIDKASLIKQLNSLVITARAKYFFKKLRDNYERWIRISTIFREACMKFTDEEQERIRNILRKKLKQWREKAIKITEEANKIRIAKYFEERYRISSARQNWKKLAREYDAFCENKELYYLRKRLAKFITIHKLNNLLKEKFTKTGKEQFEDGVKFVNLLRFIKYLIENWDQRNQLLTMKHYLRRWQEKADKLRKRDEALEEAFAAIERRSLMEAAEAYKNVSIFKKLMSAYKAARAIYFFQKLRDNLNRWLKIRKLFQEACLSIAMGQEEYNREVFRKKFRQWAEKARKTTEEINKNRIAQYLEERYRIANARKNWLKLSRMYDMMVNKNELFVLVQKIKKYVKLQKLTDMLKKKFTKEGDNRLRDGINYLNTLRFIKLLFENWDKRNELATLKYFLKKWNDKAKKLKDREDALIDVLYIIEKKDIQNAADAIYKASLIKKTICTYSTALKKILIDKLKQNKEMKDNYNKLAGDLIKDKEDIEIATKERLLTNLYKVYYYKIFENLFNKLESMQDDYRLKHAKYLFQIVHYIYSLTRQHSYTHSNEGEMEPKTTKLHFQGKVSKDKKEPLDKSLASLVLPRLIKFLNARFLSHKHWAFENLHDDLRAKRFCDLYKKYSNREILPPKRDLVDYLKAESIYMEGIPECYSKLFKLFRKYWNKMVCQSMVEPSRIYKILYLIKMSLMHKSIALQRFLKGIIRKWRFSTFLQNITRRKMQALYKNMHVCYLQMTDEIFGDKGDKDPSVVKEFERIVGSMGAFQNEDYNIVQEHNYVDKVTKKYIFPPMESFFEKEGMTQYCYSSGMEFEDSGELNEDFYVDKDYGDTMGKYKLETNKSASRVSKNGTNRSKGYKS